MCRAIRVGTTRKDKKREILLTLSSSSREREGARERAGADRTGEERFRRIAAHLCDASREEIHGFARSVTIRQDTCRRVPPLRVARHEEVDRRSAEGGARPPRAKPPSRSRYHRAVHANKSSCRRVPFAPSTRDTLFRRSSRPPSPALNPPSVCRYPGVFNFFAPKAPRSLLRTLLLLQHRHTRKLNNLTRRGRNQIDVHGKMHSQGLFKLKENAHTTSMAVSRNGSANGSIVG